MSKSIFKNTIFKSLLNFCNIVIPILIGPYIARTLDVHLFGIYNNAVVQFQVVLILAGFGIYNYGLREISKIRESKKMVNKLFSELFLINIISHIIIFVIYFLIIEFVKVGIELYVYMILSIELLGDFFAIEWVNEGFENYKFIAIKTLIIRLIYIVLIFLFVRKSSDIISYTSIMSLTLLLNNIISFIYIKKKINISFKNLKLKKYIKPLIYMLIISNIGILYTQLDKIMVGHFINAESVTLYQIPHFIAGVFNTIAVSIIVVSIPRLTNLLNNGRKKQYEKLLKQISSIYLLFIIPFCFGMMSLSKEILFIYGGNKYIQASTVLFLFSIVYLISSLDYLYSNVILFVNGYEKKMLQISLIGGLINLVLNSLLVLINKFTVNSAVLTLGIAYLSNVILNRIFITKHLGLKNIILNKTNVTYYLLAMLFLPISYYLKNYVINLYVFVGSTIIVCATLYLGILLLIKDENIYMIVKRILNIKKK